MVGRGRSLEPPPAAQAKAYGGGIRNKPLTEQGFASLWLDLGEPLQGAPPFCLRRGWLFV